MVLLAGEGCRAGVCPDFSALEPRDRGYGQLALHLAPFFMGPDAAAQTGCSSTRTAQYSSLALNCPHGRRQNRISTP